MQKNRPQGQEGHGLSFGLKTLGMQTPSPWSRKPGPHSASRHGSRGLETRPGHSQPPPRPADQRGSHLPLPGPSQPSLLSLSEGLSAAAPLITRSFSRAHFGAASQNPPTEAGDRRDLGWIPGRRRSPGGGHGNPPRYSCRENPMDRGAWWATVHGVTESDMTEAT